MTSLRIFHGVELFQLQHHKRTFKIDIHFAMEPFSVLASPAVFAETLGKLPVDELLLARTVIVRLLGIQNVHKSSRLP